MNKEKIRLLINTITEIKKAHKKEDIKMLHYCSNVLDGLSHLHGFSDLLEYYFNSIEV